MSFYLRSLGLLEADAFLTRRYPNMVLNLCMEYRPKFKIPIQNILKAKQNNAINNMFF